MYALCVIIAQVVKEAGMVSFVVISEQDQFIEAFKALADPARMRILALLWRPGTECCSEEDRICGCDVGAELGLSQPTVSHHMKVLVRAGLVLATKDGRLICYNINRYSFSAMTGFLSKYAEDVSAAIERKKSKGKGSRPERHRQQSPSDAHSAKLAAAATRRNPVRSKVA